MHAPVGKVSFTAETLRQNVVALVEALQKAKPSAAKGTYMKKVSISSTMGPGVNIDLAEIGAILK